MSKCIYIYSDEWQTELYDVETVDGQLPIIYSEDYNIKFGGLQKLHPFDSEKWGRIARFLESM